MRDVLVKKDLKVGNCSIANSNIAVHFQLAAEYMLAHLPESKVGFVVAYRATQAEYKKFRKNDRVEAYLFLLNDRCNNASAEEYFYNFIQASEKLLAKDNSSSNKENSYLSLIGRQITDLCAATQK